MYKIYLIYAETDGIGQWKIGITKDINTRLQTLKVGNPNIVDVFSTYDIEDRVIAYRVETLMKKHFKQYKVNGEWFLHHALNKDIFLELCARYESATHVWKDIQNNIKNDKNNYYR